MKQHKIFTYTISVPLLCLCFSLVSLPEHTTSTQDIVTSFLPPITFTKSGVESFFTERFNTRLYAERFLPVCFIHVIDYLEYGALQNKPAGYAESVLHLFHQRLKESTWTNPYAVLTLLNRLPTLLQPYCSNTSTQEKLIQQELKKALKENFTQLKTHPQTFLEETSTAILSTFQTTQSEANSLISITDRFIEQCLSKLIWNPYEKLEIWESVKVLAEQCIKLHEKGFFEEQSLNHHIWTLLFRFGHFIHCAGSHMSPGFYHAIEKEIEHTPHLAFLNLEEEDAHLTTKRDYLIEVLRHGKIKTQFHEQGLLLESVL